MIRIVACLENKQGGEKVAVEELIHALQKLKTTETSIELITFTFRLYSTHTQFFLSSLFFWIKRLFLRKYDVILVTSPSQYLASLLSKGKTIYLFHGDKSFSYNEIDSQHKKLIFKKMYGYFWVFLNNFLFELALEKSTTIVVPHKKTIEYILGKFPFLKKKKIIVVPNGIDVKRFKPVSLKQKRILRTQLSISPKKKIITYIGRLDRLKNIHLIISAIKQLGQAFQLYIVHPQPQSIEEKMYFEELKHMNAINNRKNVFFIQGEYKSIQQWYQVSDLIILPSSIEQSSQVIKESISCKIPILISNTGDSSEYPQKFIIKTLTQDGVLESLNSFFSLTPHEKTAIWKDQKMKQINHTWEKSAQIFHNKILNNILIRDN